jgi:hypothetical protein
MKSIGPTDIGELEPNPVSIIPNVPLRSRATAFLPLPTSFGGCF